MKFGGVSRWAGVARGESEVLGCGHRRFSPGASVGGGLYNRSHLKKGFWRVARIRHWGRGCHRFLKNDVFHGFTANWSSTTGVYRVLTIGYRTKVAVDFCRPRTKVAVVCVPKWPWITRGMHKSFPQSSLSLGRHGRGAVVESKPLRRRLPPDRFTTFDHKCRRALLVLGDARTFVKREHLFQRHSED